MFIVDLVKAGSLGFAAACLVLSYLLLKKIMNSDEFEGEDLTVRCKEIRIFMCVSVLVIVIGITGELAGKMLVPQVNVRFDIAPARIAKDLVVKAGGKKVDIEKGEEVQMWDRDEVSLNLSDVDAKLNELTLEIKFLNSRSEGASNELLALKKRQAAETIQAAAEEAGL